MKKTVKPGILLMLIVLIVTFVNAQITSTGTYNGILAKFELSKFTVLERDVNLTISNKTITGKVTLRMDWNAAISTIKVKLKGEGIDYDVTTVSCRTYDPTYVMVLIKAVFLMYTQGK